MRAKGFLKGEEDSQTQDGGKAPRASSVTEPSSSGLITGAHVFVALVF